MRAAQSTPRACATFDLVANPRQWIQFGGGQLNACYPRQRHPSALLYYLGGELDSWQAGRYLTVQMGEKDPVCIANWILGYARSVLEGGPAPIFSASLGRLRAPNPMA
ncbi:hypothetical protein RD110_18830 [Rhodoferax koreense]|uniref:Uncharacterized protein n=1 Tax=Rhodoferax koreensis TaxID=1842727 RepID=A0A1P8JZ31_9BURK|nr:hypothetical protein [Rhodoferax koreense]APW39010.1 hypothetical protein RD110_18830 [Rhodoferax koreense]